ENYLYPMNGTAILAGEGYLRTVADLNWTIAGVGDFDGDGKADILWRNTSTGQNYIYLMSGTAILTEGYLRTVAGQSWQVAGIGDFDGDGKDDILRRNSSTGDNYLYFMDGTTIKPSEGYLRTVADQNWRVMPGSGAAAPAGRLVINEVDYDNVGTDSAEFIEIYNPSAAAVNLGNLAVVLVNGQTSTEYARVNLSLAGSSLAAGAYLVIGHASVLASVPAGTLVIQITTPQDFIQ